jgi:hypothetical protein
METIQLCGGVLVPPEGSDWPCPRNRWVRRCLVAEQPDRAWSKRQLTLTTDHWFPRSQDGSWGLSTVERSRTHLAHQFCQDSQGGRISSAKLVADRLASGYFQTDAHRVVSAMGPAARVTSGQYQSEAHKAIGPRAAATRRASGQYQSDAHKKSSARGGKNGRGNRHIGHHNGAVKSNHIRWHVNRGIVNPECSLC